MPKSSENTNITPFIPSPFPPRRLKRLSFAKQLKEAHRTLKELSGLLTSLPKETYSRLLIREAVDSLNSQKIHVSLKYLIQTPRSQWKAAPIRDYLEAFEWASRHIKKSPFSKKQICKIHSIVKRSSSHRPDLGRYRNRQNWIGPAGCTIDEAYFYPPPPDRVNALMNQLLRYANRKEKDPLLQLALFSAQLLIIHPFMDGNGRIARILVPLFLYKKSILPLPFFLFSGYFKSHRLQYLQALYKISEEGNWENWIAFFLKGLIITGRKTKNLGKLASRGSKVGLF